jgi:hypothetical protein
LVQQGQILFELDARPFEEATLGDGALLDAWGASLH